MSGYGNEQSQYTLNRASYGDVPAGMMMGMHNTMSGAYGGMNNMLSDVGRAVMPVSYTPNARVNVGFYGQYQQQTGFFSSMAGTVGLGGPGRSQMASDYMYNNASDFGERLGGGAAGLGATIGSMGIGSLMGKMLGGGIVGGLAGAFVGSAAAGVVMDAVGQRREISNYLENSSYRYTTSGSGMNDSRHGGMNRGARQQVGEMIRGMDVKDPFLSTEDLTMVLQQGTQKGLFAGTSDMGDFKKKFKDLTDAVKTVARTLNQTLEESMSTIKELKSIGIDPSQAGNVTKSASTLGHMAGRTGAEMLNVGLQGAELFRGTGVNMGIGAQATMMNLATVRASRDAGQLSNEAVAQAGGEEALALRMNASGLGFAQSTVGRGFGAAFAGAGGAFNTSKFMSTAMGGGGNLIDMATQAAGNLSSPAALIAYQANQAKFTSEMGKTFGNNGFNVGRMMTTAAQAAFMSGATGAKMEDSYHLAALQEGRTESEIAVDFAQMRGARSINKSANAATQMAYEKNAIEEAYRNSPFTNIGSKVRDWGKSIIDPVARPISNVIDNISESMITSVEEHVYGTRRRKLNTGMSDYISEAATGGGPARVNNIDVGGAWGGLTAGKALNNLLTPEMQKAFNVKTRDIYNTKDLRSDETIIRDHELQKTAINLEKLADNTKNWNFSKDDVTRASEKNLLTTPETMTAKLLAYKGDVNDANDLSMAVLGKPAWQATKLEAMSMDATFGGHAKYGGRIAELKAMSSVANNGSNAKLAEGTIQAVDRYQASKKDYISSIGINEDALQGADTALAKFATAGLLMAKNPTKAAELQNSAKTDLVSKGFSKETAEAISLKTGSAKYKLNGQSLVNDHNAYVEAMDTQGSSRVVDMIAGDAVDAALSDDERGRVTGVMKDATRGSAADFIRLVDGNKDLLNKTVTGVGAVKTMEQMKKLDNLKGTERHDLGAIKKIMGDDFKSVSALANSGGVDALINKNLSDFKEGKLGGSTTSTGAGNNKDGPSAAETMTQQMRINEANMNVQLGLAKRLGII